MTVKLGGGGVGVILYKVGTVRFLFEMKCFLYEMFYFKKRVGTSLVDSELLLQGVRVQFLVGEIKSHIPCNQEKVFIEH